MSLTTRQMFRLAYITACMFALALPRIACSQVTIAKTLYHWEGWEDLGGTIQSEIDCLAPTAGRLDCFGIGTNGSLTRKKYDAGWSVANYSGIVIGNYGSANNGYADIRPAGANCLSYASDRVDCFAIGGDNALYHRWWEAGAEGWWENLGGIATAMPSCVSMASRHIDCFIRALNGNLQWRWWDGDLWRNNWSNSNLGGTIAASTRPVCVAWHSASGNRIDCIINSMSPATTPTATGYTNDLRVNSLIPTSNTINGTTTTIWNWTGWSTLPMNGASLPSDQSPKCVANGGALFCIAWAFWADGTFRMTRWTLTTQGWVMSDLGNDSGDAASTSTYGVRLWRDFDCTARGSDTIDCIELVGRTTNAPLPGFGYSGAQDTSVHLRHTSWSANNIAANPTAAASWTTFISSVSSPFTESHLRCASWSADRIDCFAARAGLTAGGPLMHAWFIPTEYFRRYP